MVNFYHDLRIIIKHRSTVILSARWLIDLFGQLITIPDFTKMVTKCILNVLLNLQWFITAPILGDITGVAGHPNYRVNVVKLKCYVDRRVTLPKRVTSPAWGPPPPCTRALR